MKKIILIGNVACGKTTICQYLNHMEIKYKKTQALEVYNTTIDTPGEYLENRGYLRSLMVTATETDQVVFVQDASRDQFFHSFSGHWTDFKNRVRTGTIQRFYIACSRGCDKNRHRDTKANCGCS